MKLTDWQSTKNTIKDITEAAIIKAVQNDYHALTMTNAIPIQLIYFIQFMLEDIRVTFRHDLNLDLGGVFIDAKDGDISMIPRWLAKVLNRNGVLDIQDIDVSSYVSRSLNRERIARPHDLSGIDPDFYIRLKDHLEASSEDDRERLSVSLNSFIASRLEKIAKLAAASPLSPEVKEKLSAEEYELYLIMHRNTDSFKQTVLNKYG
jgi:DNA replication factor GINS